MSLGLRAVFKLISLPVLPLRADPRERTWLEELLKTIYKSHCGRLQIQFYDYVLSPTLQRIGGRDRERRKITSFIHICSPSSWEAEAGGL